MAVGGPGGARAGEGGNAYRRLSVPVSDDARGLPGPVSATHGHPAKTTAFLRPSAIGPGRRGFPWNTRPVLGPQALVRLEGWLGLPQRRPGKRSEGAPLLLELQVAVGASPRRPCGLDVVGAAYYDPSQVVPKVRSIAGRCPPPHEVGDQVSTSSRVLRGLCRSGPAVGHGDEPRRAASGRRNFLPPRAHQGLAGVARSACSADGHCPAYRGVPPVRRRLRAPISGGSHFSETGPS